MFLIKICIITKTLQRSNKNFLQCCNFNCAFQPACRFFNGMGWNIGKIPCFCTKRCGDNNRCCAHPYCLVYRARLHTSSRGCVFVPCKALCVSAHKFMCAVLYIIGTQKMRQVFWVVYGVITIDESGGERCGGCRCVCLRWQMSLSKKCVCKRIYRIVEARNGLFCEPWEVKTADCGDENVFAAKK